MDVHIARVVNPRYKVELQLSTQELETLMKMTHGFRYPLRPTPGPLEYETEIAHKLYEALVEGSKA